MVDFLRYRKKKLNIEIKLDNIRSIVKYNGGSMIVEKYKRATIVGDIIFIKGILLFF